MPAKKSPSVSLSAAADARRRANASAERLLDRAISLYAAEMPPPAESIKSAAIPIAGGKTMTDAQKFRVNWYGINRKALQKIARLLVERNWFARPVHRLNMSLYGGGFQFKESDAREWATKGTYPFMRLHDDLLHEYLVNDCALAFWRTDAGPNELPMIEVPNMEDVDYEVVGGVPTVWIKVATDRKLDESLKERMGEKLFTAVKTGKPLILAKGDAASGYDFEIIKLGKSTGLIQPPGITGVIDDLDYIEAVRVGDWNGAWSRREIIRHTKKGFGVSSGPNAGSTRGNAKYPELQTILKAMRNLVGKTDIATNYDQAIDWLTFPNDFFSPEMVKSALQRLLFWGGLPAILLLSTDSQITGLATLLYDRTRGEVESFRERFAPFLNAIFNSESFKKNFPAAPDLSVGWNVKSLYSSKSLTEFATFAHTYGVLAPPTIRGLFGVDDVVESARMMAAHENRDAYTPPYEPRQGLLPSLFPLDYNQDPPAAPGDPPAAPAKKTAAPASKTSARKLPGKPGRPAAE